MKVDVRDKNGVIVVELSGRLVAGVGDEVLRDVMNELVARGWKAILIDLSDVPRIDSAGIGELVAGIRLGERFGSSVKLLNLSGQVEEVLEMSSILPLVQVFNDEEEAVSSFGDLGEAASTST